jgi:hypothetical protein
VLILAIHLLVTLAKFLRPDGVRRVAAMLSAPQTASDNAGRLPQLS